MGCKDTTVEGVRIEHTGGDGISVWSGHRYNGHKRPASPPPCPDNPDCACENTLIRDVVCDSNYRAAHEPFFARNLPGARSSSLRAEALDETPCCGACVCAGQGMSIMLAQHLRVVNSTFSNTAGTLPAAGLDSMYKPQRIRRSCDACLALIYY